MDNAELLARLISIFAEEQAEMVAELHDGLMPDVVGARMWLNSVRTSPTPTSDEARAALEVIQHALDRATQDARNVINELSLSRDAASQHAMCIDQIVDYWRRRGARVEYHVAADLQLHDALRPILGLTLAWLFKYAVVDVQAERICLRISGGGSLAVEFEHNGPTTAATVPAESAPRLGFVKRRVELLDGQFEVNARRTGQTVTLRLPIDGKGPTLLPMTSDM